MASNEMHNSPSVDANVLRSGIRLVHCLQKERGSSCAYYADNKRFEDAMLDARFSSDTAASLFLQNDLPITSSLAKIRDLVPTHKNPQDTDDNLDLHRILSCFNTLISYVVHECILKQISEGTDHQPRKCTIKNRHRRGLSIDINDKIASTFTTTPEANVHKTYPPPTQSGNGITKRASEKDLPLYSVDEEGSRTAPPPPPPPPPPTKPTGDPSGETSLNKGAGPPSETVAGKVKELLDLLEVFVLLKESAGVERAILSSLLAFRETRHDSLGFLINDLVLQVENQRSLFHQLENLPDNHHRNLVLDLASLSPRLQELHHIILSDFESLRNAKYDSEAIWNLITIYVDKLHSVELLMVEELECCLPVNTTAAGTSGAVSHALVSQDHMDMLPLTSSSASAVTPANFTEGRSSIHKALQRFFMPAASQNNLVSKIESMSPEDVKRQLLQLVKVDNLERVDPLSTSSASGALQDGDIKGAEVVQQYSIATNLKEDMNRALSSAPDRATANEWEISVYELKFTKRIGRGAAATTYMANWSGQQVAVKVASISTFGLVGWRTEVDALKRLHHPNIIRLMGSVYHENPLTYCLVLEYCNAGDLSTALKYPTPRNFFFKVSLEIANAMAYLHSRHVIHRDLKPANVLCNGNVPSGKFTVKVTDFGLSTEIKDASLRGGEPASPRKSRRRNLTGETGTYRWMGPEVIRHESYSNMADVYSFAIMLWQFVTHEEPFEDVGSTDAARLTAECQRPPFPSGTPDRLKQIIESNWSQKPEERVPFEKIAEELQTLQNGVNSDELKFLENSHGHPVYVYDEPSVGESEEDDHHPSDRSDVSKSRRSSNGVNRRNSLLSSFFSHKKPEQKMRRRKHY